MIKDLLIALANSRGDDAALAAGVVLAEDHHAHLAALVCVPLTIPIAFEWSALPADLYARVHQAERERGQRVAAHVRDTFAKSTATTEVRIVETLVMPRGSVAALHGRHADLSIVGGVSEEAPGWADGIFLDLLFDSGRPVLVVPPQFIMKAPPRHAIVAWQPSREAARALHDSLPLLKRAESVEVLVIDPVVAENRHGEEPGADIATHLARHGLRVSLVARPLMGEQAATVIVRHAMETGADLVVAGGYSHARVRETLLGGVTRSLLEICPVPLLLSH
jgi:nucleotide-binding universal stress UspA family protein